MKKTVGIRWSSFDEKRLEPQANRARSTAEVKIQKLWTKWMCELSALYAVYQVILASGIYSGFYWTKLFEISLIWQMNRMRSKMLWGIHFWGIFLIHQNHQHNQNHCAKITWCTIYCRDIYLKLNSIKSTSVLTL